MPRRLPQVSRQMIAKASSALYGSMDGKAEVMAAAPAQELTATVRI